MSTITYPDKNTGDLVTALDMNEIKDVVNNNNIINSNLGYYFNSADNVTIIDDTYQNVVSLDTPVLAAGVYEIKFALTYNLNVAIRSVYLRWTTNGGGVWTEFVSEPKDSTDDVPLTYFYPITHAGGALDFQIEMRKESAGDILIVHFADAIIDQKS